MGNVHRVYVAGALSAPDCISYLNNVRKGIEVSKEVLLHGHACFSPFIDFMLFLGLHGEEKISLTTIQRHSMAWLEVSDCVLVVPGWENSRGTRAEMERAKQLVLPIMFWDKAFDWKLVDEVGYRFGEK